MSRRRALLVLAVAVLTVGSVAGFADDARKAPDAVLDDELLEFLGSVDPSSDTVQPDDGTWLEYLSKTDISKVAKPGNTIIAAKPATPPPSKPDSQGAKQHE